MRLRLEQRRGETYIAEQYDQAPLKVIRPFRLEGGRVLLHVVNTTAAVLGGDFYRMEISVGTGAKVVLAHQATTKVFTMASGAFSTENIRIHVATRGELECYPGLLIPFPDSDFRQLLEVHLDAGAKFGYLGQRAMGRTARDEYLAFRTMSTPVRVYREGRPVFMDALELGRLVYLSVLLCRLHHWARGMANTRTILIIGAGPNQVPAIKLARARGLRVVATDMDPEAEGSVLADAHGVVSTREAEGTTAFAREVQQQRGLQGVMAMASESAVAVAAVAQALGLPGVDPQATWRAVPRS